MGKYVVDTSVMLQMLQEGIEVPSGHQLLAPTLIRSQVLDALYHAVHVGELPEKAGLGRLAKFSEMKIRFLGDKVLRRTAWTIAKELGWGSTHYAEYIALTQLQADALVTPDADLASAASEFVSTTTLESLL